MQEQQNIDLVRKLYGAFSKGDIQTIVDHLADQVIWRFDAPSVIPYGGDHSTPDEVRKDFSDLWPALKKTTHLRLTNSSRRMTR